MRVLAERYELGAPLARGGMSQGFKGSDTRLNRPVAVKLIRGDTADHQSKRRFRREARITARLGHPGIPVIYDFGEDTGEYFLVMEHLDGCTVADVIAEAEELPPSWAAVLGAQLCAALAAAHAEGLIHRDIKPGNVMVAPTGAVKLVDFGVAAALEADDYSRITEQGQAPGTLGYFPPEVIEGGPADRAGDLYAVGCLLHEMLTGRPLFQSTDLVELLDMHHSLPPAALAGFRPDVPEGLASLIAALLAKDPAARPSSAEAVAARLLDFVTQLPPLHGLVDRPGGPVHLYAKAVERASRPAHS